MLIDTHHKIHRPPRLSEEVATTLEARVKLGVYAPGAQLPTEKVLAESFGVSRAVVREAIARLKADGMIVTRQGAGAFVAEAPKSLNFRLNTHAGEKAATDTLLPIFELRAILEATVSELAARRRTEADLDAMRQCLDRMDVAMTPESDGMGGSEADDDFHLAVAAATHNPYVLKLSEFLGRQFSESRRMTWESPQRDADSPLAAQREHYRLLEAIAAQDPEAARQASFRHLNAAAERLGLALPEDLATQSLAAV